MSVSASDSASDSLSARAFALAVLQRGDLAAKLAPPDDVVVDACDAADAPLFIDAPARDPALALATVGAGKGAGKLPPLGALGDPAARVACLERFAHHELQAVELFAWALLAFPALPEALRRGFLFALRDEQLHCRLYLDRLAAHGAQLERAPGAPPLSDYFWRHVPAIRAAADPPLAFLCAMGLTLEAANLDFTLLYRDAFRAAGDEETAAVLQRVHDDELAHVRLAAVWATRLSGAASDVDAYRQGVPFPFSAARAKARRFDGAARRRAGLSEEMIRYVADAKPYRS